MPGFCASIFLVFISGVGHFNFIVDRGKSARAWLEGNPQEHHVVAERNYGTLETFSRHSITIFRSSCTFKCFK